MSDRFTVRWSASAQKSFARLDRQIADRIFKAARLLEENPFPRSSKPLKGFDGLFRLRVGDYRIVYRVDGSRLIVLLVTLGHRRKVYRRIPKGNLSAD